MTEIEQSNTEQFIKIASAADIAEGEIKVVRVRGKRIVICRRGGNFFAIDDRCTHDNGPLGEGQLIDDEIECPRHGARFDIKTGKALCLPAVGGVAIYDVQVRDGELWLAVPLHS